MRFSPRWLLTLWFYWMWRYVVWFSFRGTCYFHLHVFYIEDECNRSLWNVGIYISNHTASHPRRPQSLYKVIFVVIKPIESIVPQIKPVIVPEGSGGRLHALNSEVPIYKNLPRNFQAPGKKTCTYGFQIFNDNKLRLLWEGGWVIISNVDRYAIIRVIRSYFQHIPVFKHIYTGFLMRKVASKRYDVQQTDFNCRSMDTVHIRSINRNAYNIIFIGYW